MSLRGRPSVVSARRSPGGSFYAASTLEGQISIWNGKSILIWETNASVHPIHLLRFSETKFSISTPDGCISSWDLVDGKPTQEEPVVRGPQLTDTPQSVSSHSNGTISWFPFRDDAGLWAYVNNCFIHFEGEEGEAERSVTIIELSE